MRPDDPGGLESALAAAVAAFDAGNHAFGRFVTYAVRPHGGIPPSVQAVRERLQDAALAVPDAPSTDAAREFLTALKTALSAVDAFLADPPVGYALEEACVAPDALREAVEAFDGLFQD